MFETPDFVPIDHHPVRFITAVCPTRLTLEWVGINCRNDQSERGRLQLMHRLPHIRNPRMCGATPRTRAEERAIAQRRAVSNRLAVGACIAYNPCMQYTIRNVPNALDAALRRRAQEQRKSLNEVAIDALARGAGFSRQPDRQRDLGDIAGTWRSDRAFDRALAAQDTIDKELWQ